MADPNNQFQCLQFQFAQRASRIKKRKCFQRKWKELLETGMLDNSFEFQQIGNESCQSHGETNVFYEEDYCYSEKEVDNNSKMFKIFWVNPKGLSFNKRISGQRMLTGKELICVVSWKWGISSSKKYAQKITEKSKNCEVVVVKIKLDGQNWTNCLWSNRGILKQWVSLWLRSESCRRTCIPWLMQEISMLPLRAALERPTLPVRF